MNGCAVEYQNRFRFTGIVIGLVMIISISVSTLAAQPARQVIYQEDFEDAAAQNWELESPWQVSSESNNHFLHGKTHAWATYSQGDHWTQYSLECRIKLLGDEGLHVNVRLDESGRYFVGFHPGSISLNREQPWGTITDLEDQLKSSPTHQWHTLTIEAEGDTFFVSVNDTLLIEYEDTSGPDSGSIGFETLADASVYVDDIRVYRESTTGNTGFQGLGDLAGNVSLSRADAVSADGSDVVGMSSSSNGSEAFHWSSAAGIVGLGDLAPGRFASAALGISANDSVVVGHSIIDDEWGYQAFRWSAQEGMAGLGFLAPEIKYSAAWDASADGSVIVGESESNTGREAFRWTASSGMQGLGFPTGNSHSVARAVSDDGSVVVGYSLYDAFYWTLASGITQIGSGCQAFDITPDGSMIVGNCKTPDGFRLIRWDSAFKIDTLGVLEGKGSYSSQMYRTSGDGETIVGYYLDSQAEEKAFVWRASHGVLDLQYALGTVYGLDLTGWTLKTAADISDDGSTLVGWGVNPQGNTEAWRARIPLPTGVRTVEKPSPAPLPADFILYQNIPNPFNPVTTISFALKRQSDVRLVVYNSLGQIVRVLVDTHLPAGPHRFSWDGMTDYGKAVVSGVYYYRLKTQHRTQTKKMLLLK